MRRLAFAIALACVLSGVVRAGEIPSTGAIAPPPSSPLVIPGEIHSTGGEIPSTGATAPQESTTVLTIVLALLDIVP
jgi:hypothetical protein